jgi:hypothetical protein
MCLGLLSCRHYSIGMGDAASEAGRKNALDTYAYLLDGGISHRY